MNKERNPEQEPSTREFWNVDETVGRIHVYGAPHTLGFRSHLAEESYRGRRDLVHLNQATGTRDYVLVHPYIVIPTVRRGTDRVVARAPGTSNGHRSPLSIEAARREWIGDGQAWFYREDRTLVLWECMLFTRHRQPRPQEDPNLHVLWQRFEHILRRRFPSARRIVTPQDEPEYDADTWEQFLSGRGFHALGGGAFGKEVKNHV
jgi:hypothetical protein